MKPQDKIDHNEFQELHKHKGSENYEVVEIFDNKFEIKDDFLVDKKNKNIVSYGYKEQKLEDKNQHLTKRISNLGEEMGVIENSYPILKDGTIWAGFFYKSWIVDNNIKRHKYIDPFTDKEISELDFKVNIKDPEKWMKKFKELYANAQYIYIYISSYYFKIDNKWYTLKANLEGLPKDLKTRYPPKEDQDIRMVELKNLAPVFYYGKPEKLDTQLIKKIDYESTYFKEVDKGLNQYNFSAGWWYLEIYTPLGETIKIKRYSNFEDPELMLYKIPDAYGGRQDVLFIVQNPEELFMSQVGGMYAIRPRDPEQPQRRYNLIVYKRDKDGYKIIDKEKSIETEEYKDWVKKKRR